MSAKYINDNFSGTKYIIVKLKEENKMLLFGLIK